MSKPKRTVTPQERKAQIVGKKIATAVTAAISACSNGAPTPLIYAPLSPWLSYDQFKALWRRWSRTGCSAAKATSTTPPMRKP